MTLLVKAIGMVAILATFSVLLVQWSENSVNIGGWNQLLNAVNDDPFDDLPALPTLPGPASDNVTTGAFYFRQSTSGQVNCPEIMSRTAGTDPAVTVTLNAGNPYICWLFQEQDQSHIAGVWDAFVWLSSPGVPTYTWALVGWNSFFGGVGELVCADESTSAVGSPVNFFCVPVPAKNIQVAFQLRWLSGANLVVSYDGATNISRVESPGSSSSGSQCRWDSPLTWLDCGGDAAGFAGGGFLYIGGLIWSIANGVFAVFAWFINVIISFFGALLGLGQFIATLGGTAPQEVQYLTGGVFVVFMSIIFVEIINLFRGVSPA